MTEFVETFKSIDLVNNLENHVDEIHFSFVISRVYQHCNKQVWMNIEKAIIEESFRLNYFPNTNRRVIFYRFQIPFSFISESRAFCFNYKRIFKI